MARTDWEALSLKTQYRCSEYFYRMSAKIPPTTDNELIAECAKYGMEVVWHEGLGMYLIGKGDQYYGVIGEDWREEGIDMPAVIAELFVTGTFGVEP
jgi:hypothetical protein